MYMAQVEGTMMYSRVFTSPCYHLPRSLGFMCSMGFLSLQNFHFFFFNFLCLFSQALPFFSTTQLTAFLPWSVECTPGHFLPSPQPNILT